MGARINFESAKRDTFDGGDRSEGARVARQFQERG